MREKLLFITMNTEQVDEGLDYVLQLATTMFSGIAIILVSKSPVSSIYENLISSITSAGRARETALRMLQGDDSELDEAERTAIEALRARCAQHSIAPSIHLMSGDPLKVIETFVAAHSGIEMVFLSPSLSARKDIKRVLKQNLLKRIDKPVVTIRRLTESAG